MDFMRKQLIECAGKVYETLGCGHSESVYHRAMEVELRVNGYCFESKKVIPINYQGYNVGSREVDMLVHSGGGNMVLEFKAVNKLTDANKVQVKSYMGECGSVSGILINFPTIGKDIDFIIINESN